MVSIRKFLQGIGLIPVSATAIDTKGEMECLSSDGRIYWYDGSAVQKVAGIATTDTLTNKTLTAPVISTISNSGTITIPTGTDTLVGKATTDTLTNKTLTSPTIAKLANLTTNGYVKTGSGDGTLSVQTVGIPIADGGTGATSKAAAFDALSPMSASGDIIYGGASGTGTRLAKGSDTQVLTLASGVPTWATPAASGVTSVAMTVPSILSVSGSPITTSGTLAVTLATETANLVFAGPASGSAATPTFRALNVTDQTIATQAISASDIDWSTGNVFTKSLGANTTFTFSNKLSGQVIMVRLTNSASNWTVTWPTVKWAGGVAPTMTVGAVSDVYTFMYDGTNVYGSAVQNMS